MNFRGGVPVTPHPKILTICKISNQENIDYNRIPITQYHTNSVYSRSAIISVIALLVTNQPLITLYCTPMSAKKCNRLLIDRNGAGRYGQLQKVNKILCC